FDGDAFFSSAITAGADSALARSARANPRGRCAAAACSIARTSALAFRSATTSRVCARISGKYIVRSVRVSDITYHATAVAAQEPGGGTMFTKNRIEALSDGVFAI